MSNARRFARLAFLSLGLATCVRDAPLVRPSPATSVALPSPEPQDSAELPLPDGAFLEVLGVAQDAGVPQAACSSVNCEAARLDRSLVRYATSLVVVGTKGETYLFEATPDLRPQLDRVIELGEQRGRPDQGRKLLDGVFLTHAHMGHYSGLLHLGFEAAHSQEVPMYASAKMISFLENNQPWRQLIEIKNLVPEVGSPGAALELSDGIVVRALAVPHRDELSDTVAWRIEGPRRTLLFMPDCDPWSRWEARGFALAPMLEGVDTFLVDATFYSGEELPGRDLSKIMHPFVTDSIERFSAQVSAGELEVIFIHFNHSNPLLAADSAEAKKVLDAGFGLATRAMRLEL